MNDFASGNAVSGMGNDASVEAQFDYLLGMALSIRDQPADGCLSIDISSYVTGNLRPVEIEKVEKHISRCRTCFGEAVDQLSDIRT